MAKASRWYLAKSKPGESKTWIGPCTEEEVVERLQSGETSWADGIWSPTFGASWKRVYDIAEFQKHLPPLPSTDLIHAMTGTTREPGKAVVDDSSGALWYLQFDGSEFGPMTLQEVGAILMRGKLTGQLLGWRSGFTKWQPVAQIPEFSALLAVSKEAMPLNLRHADRKAFVAAIRFAEKVTDRAPDVFSGVARDISASGMRITTDHVPNNVGTPLIMSVQPVDNDVIPQFSVEAEVARIVGERIFAVRFKALEKTIEKAIVKFTTK